MRLRIKKFITEEDVSYYRHYSDYELKSQFNRFIKLGKKEGYSEKDVRRIFGLPEGDIDTLLKQFRESYFTRYCRRNEWKHDSINVLNNNGIVLEYKIRTAEFRYVNKWNQESEIEKYMFIIDNGYKLLWFGRCYDKHYYISVDKKIYQIGYEDEYLYLVPNLIREDVYYDEINEKNNDDLIRKFSKNTEGYRCIEIEEAKKLFEEEKTGACIDLEKHFEKGFFCKERKWNKNREIFFGYRCITIMFSITTKEGLFCIEIENITKPHYGYILLDLSELKIIEARNL